VFLATLHAVHVIIHVKETNSEDRSRYDSLVHLAYTKGVQHNKTKNDHLNNGHRWYTDLGYQKAFFQLWGVLGRFWGESFHLRAVTWHFYFILRN